MEDFLFRSKLGRALLLVGFVFGLFEGVIAVTDRLDRKKEELTATVHINEYVDAHMGVVDTGLQSFVTGMPFGDADSKFSMWLGIEPISFIRINLENTGDKPITTIKVRVASALKYALADGLVPKEIEKDDKGASVGDLAPGDREIVYVWARSVGSIDDISELERKEYIKVTHDEGLARTVFSGESSWGPIADFLRRATLPLILLSVFAMSYLATEFQISRRPPKKK